MTVFFFRVYPVLAKEGKKFDNSRQILYDEKKQGERA